MKFLLQKIKGNSTGIHFIKGKIEDSTQAAKNVLLVDDSLDRIFVVEDKSKKLYWLGDLVLPENKNSKEEFLQDLNQHFTPEKILYAGGFFYVIFYDTATSDISVYNSFSGMLSVYYTEDENQFLVSSDLKFIKQFSQQELTISKRFILEKVLFNYPLSDVSFYNNVSAMPAFHSLTLNEKSSVNRYFDISSWFADNPVKWNKKTNDLTNIFLSRLGKYLPDEPFCLSFTGGFDGRSLLAGSNLFHLPDLTYSFGKSDNFDIVIPALQANELNIPYKAYYLDDGHYLDKSLAYGLNLVETTDGIADFARAHYIYAIDKLSKQYKYCITGTMGSEIFRALHVTGSFMSKETYLLFEHDEPEVAFKELFKAKALESLEMEEYSSAVNELKDYLVNSTYFFTKTNKNQAFYRLVFDVMFRGYFGQEIKVFNRYLNNRAPYLDATFIRALMKTNLSGVYSEFFEHNPLKRFKGQIFYADLIRKSKSPLYSMDTAKGYSPKDLNTLSGKLKIIKRYFQKRKNSPTVADPFCVKEAFTLNREKLKEINIDGSLFRASKIEDDLDNHKDVPNLIRVLSLNYWINKNQQKSE